VWVVVGLSVDQDAEWIACEAERVREGVVSSGQSWAQELGGGEQYALCGEGWRRNRASFVAAFGAPTCWCSLGCLLFAGRWTFGCILLITLSVQLWMVYVKAKEANSPSSTGLLVRHGSRVEG